MLDIFTGDPSPFLQPLNQYGLLPLIELNSLTAMVVPLLSNFGKDSAILNISNHIPDHVLFHLALVGVCLHALPVPTRLPRRPSQRAPCLIPDEPPPSGLQSSHLHWFKVAAHLPLGRNATFPTFSGFQDRFTPTPHLRFPR